MVELSLETPFLASSRYYPVNEDVAATAKATTRFVLQRLSEALRAPTVNARDLLADHQSTLEVTGKVRPDLFARYRCLASDSLLDFEVPVTAMHGDFTLPNSLADDDGFVLIDWEYASERGSVLFDAWFLRRSILRQARRRGDRDLADPNTIKALDGGIDAFGLRPDQVEAFGHAMHALQDFAQLAARGVGSDTLAHSVRELERLAGGSHDRAASTGSGTA